MNNRSLLMRRLFLIAVLGLVYNLSSTYNKKEPEDKPSITEVRNTNALSESSDCGAPIEISSVDLLSRRLPPTTIAEIELSAIKYDIDIHFILAVILTQTNGDTSTGKGMFGLYDVGFPYTYESFDTEMKYFLSNSGIYTIEDISTKRLKKRKTLLEAYIKTYKPKSLNKLYNNYYLLSGENLK